MPTPLKVFCCYAREDLEMLQLLKKHLMPLQRQGMIETWSDTNLSAGVEWEKELHQHLESADIILLLISPDFMASDYCYSNAMAQAIARHNEGSAQTIPILLRPTFWQNAPFAKLQMVPTHAKPVTSWPERDDALHDITMHINLVVSKWQMGRVQEECLDQDTEVLTAARKQLELAHPEDAAPGKFNVRISGGQGIVIGDHAQSTMYFGDHPKSEGAGQ